MVCDTMFHVKSDGKRALFWSIETIFSTSTCAENCHNTRDYSAGQSAKSINLTLISPEAMYQLAESQRGEASDAKVITFTRKKLRVRMY